MTRLLLTGPFNAGQSARAHAALDAAAGSGARDILVVAANSTARRAIIAEFTRRHRAAFGLRVVTLRGLPAELERRARVRGAPAPNRVIETLLAERAVRHAVGSAFDAHTSVSGLAAKLLTTTAAIERAGGSRDGLARALEELPDAGDGARVLAEAWERLDRLRPRGSRSPAQAFLDATALLRERPELLAGCSLVVLESLPLSHAIERDLVAALVVAAPCPVVATHECAGQLDAAPASVSLDALREMAAWTVEQCTAPPDDAWRGALARIFRGGDEPTAERPLPNVRITRLETAGDVAEVRLAARVVQRHLRERGANGAPRIHPSDVLLVAHSAGRYHELIAEVFGAVGIPVSLPAERAVLDSELGTVLVRLVEIAIHPERATREASLALARAPHTDLGLRRAARLERHILTEGRLGLDGWDELSAQVLGERTMNRVNRLRRAVAAAREGFAAMKDAADAARVVRTLARDLRLVGNAYFARRRLARADSHPEILRAIGDAGIREDNQAWEGIEGALDEMMPRLLALEPAAASRRGTELAREWLALFRRVLAAESAGSPRPLADAVRVVGTAPGDGLPAKVTIVLGLLEKLFPRQPRQDPFLRDDVRRALREREGWHLQTTEEMGDRERECFLRAISTPSEALYLSCPATDAAGKPAVTSFFIDDLQRAVGLEHRFAVERLSVADVAPALSDAASPSELLAAVSHDLWQRLPRSADTTAARSAAFAAWNRLADREARVLPISSGRRAARRPVVPPGLLEGGPHRTLRLSASQLKSLGHCTYKHFLEKVIAPQSIAAPAYDARRKGSLIHDAMMEWVRLDGWRRGEQALAGVDDWFVNRIRSLTPAERESALARHQVEEDRTRLRDFLRGELDAMQGDGGFRPRWNELAFGEELTAAAERDDESVAETFDLALPTRNGEATVHFRGSIDRVDVLEVDGERYGVAIDYKTGKTSERYAKEMLDGDDLQLRLYLLALERLWGIVPVGALYVGFGDGVRRGAMRADFAGKLGGIDPEAVQLMATEQWEAFVGETPSLVAPLVERLVSLDIVADPRDGDCGFCEFGPICRYEKYAPREVTDA